VRALNNVETTFGEGVFLATVSGILSIIAGGVMVAQGCAEGYPVDDPKDIYAPGSEIYNARTPRGSRDEYL